LSALATSLLAALLMLGGAGAGVLLRRSLPHHHLNEHSKDVVRLGTALLATVTALVLGLLITSAKSTYETQRSQVKIIATKLVLLDELLKRYGPETHQARDLQRQAMLPLVDRIWGQHAVRTAAGAPFEPSREGERVYEAVESLAPRNEVQRNLKFRALATIEAITEARVLLFEESEAGLPTALLLIVIFWLTILFAGFTLFSPVNPTSLAILGVIALSASGAIFLILEMNDPFGGLMQISPAPLRQALGARGS
jgi:hypothetical protein